MATTEHIEKVINDFTSSKIGEKVYIDVSTENVIVLRPLCSRGSIPLGAFWVRLFQHRNNYPVFSYQYKNQYHAGKKYKLELRMDGLSVTINLANGLLTLKGDHIIEWFVANFYDIMVRYSSPTRACSKAMENYFTKEEALKLQREREHVFSKYFREWPAEALEQAVKVMEAGKGNQYYESINSEGFLSGQDLESYSHIPGLLNYTDTKEQLNKLREGAVIQGIVLYRLWKSTLDMWFADKSAKVYIVSPFIDCERLTDVCSLFLKNRLTACIDTICISFGTVHERFADVRKKTISRYSPQDQVFIEYKIFGNIIYPIIEFSSSFIAVIRDGKTSILQTNANFDMKNLQTTKSTFSSFFEMPEHNFLQSYLDPIIR